MKAQKLFESAVKMQLDNDLNGAKAAYQKLLRQYPTHSDVLGNLGAIVRRQGQTEAAEQLLQRALRANPRNVTAMATLANLRLSQQRPDDAHDIALQALAIQPDYVDALINLGASYARRGQLKKAESTFRYALGIDPRSAMARMNLANCFRMQKVYVDESIKELELLAQREPRNDELMMCLSMAYMENRQYVKALHYAELAYKLSQKFDYISSIANMLIILGEFEEAMAIYKDSLKVQPENNELSGTLLFALNYDDRMTAEAVFEEYRKFGLTLRAKMRYAHKDHPGIEGRKLRIGYVSADFFAHVVMFFMEPIFRNHDRNKFELFAYASVSLQDEVTQRVKKQFDHWVDAIDLADEELAERVRADQIDVLIDLSGHTTGNRLRMMAWRPAPVQATYLGYGYTTGMSEIDYFIGDNNFTPEGCEHLFSEKIIRIPSPVYAYDAPIGRSPDVAALPALSKGYVTFGSMSRIIRFNNRLLRVWKQILDRVPGSKLRLDQKPFGDPETCDRVRARLIALGYADEQIELVSSFPHWDGYHQMDIALDCWPHNAGTTTFEALWMGVPVISKRDRPSVGRLSEMVLKPMGLEDWVVDTEEEFIEKAVSFASDLPALAAMRASLRERVENSPFLDFKARTKGLEDAYVEMIRRFEEDKS